MGSRLARRLLGLVVLATGLLAALVAPARPAPEPAGHEARDVDVRAVTAAGLALGLLLLTTLAVTLWMGVDWTGRWPDLAPPATGVAGHRPVTAPGLEAPLMPDPSRVARDKRRQERAALDAWGWVDRDAGIARIPIDVAMRLVAERGLPRWDAGASPAGHPHPAAGGGGR